MKQLRVFFLVFGFFVILAISGRAGNWASVDSRLLMILHPEMENYDYSNGRFFRPGVAKKEFNALALEIKKAHETTGPLLKNLLASQAFFIRNRASLFIEKDRIIREFFNPEADETSKTQAKISKAKKSFANAKALNINPDLISPDTKRPENDQERMRKMSELEENFSKQVASYDAFLGELKDQIRAVQKTIYSSMYLTTPETREKLSLIRREISDLVASAAVEQNIEVVMDTSLSMRPVKLPEDVSMISVQPDTPDALASNLFQRFANFEAPKEPIVDANGKPVSPNHLLIGGGAVRLSELKKYLDYRNFLNEDAAEFTPGKIFLVGGQDLTLTVARKLVARYPIPDQLRNAVLKTVTDFIAFEKDNSQKDLTPFPKFYAPSTSK